MGAGFAAADRFVAEVRENRLRPGYVLLGDEIFLYATNGAGADFFVDNAFAGTPEPSTWAMMLTGFAGLAFAGYRGARARQISA